MGINIGVGGVWKDVPDVKIGVGGAWKQVQKISIGVGGVWKTMWDYIRVSAGPYSASHIVTFPGTATATIYLYNDGTYAAVDAASVTGDWMLSGAVADYDVYLSGAGTTPSGSALNTWLNLATTRSWQLSASSGNKTFTGTLQIRDAATLTVLDSQSFSLEAESTP